MRSWEASGQIGVVRVEIPTIKEAVKKFIDDGEARNLSVESVKKLRDAVERLVPDVLPTSVAESSRMASLISSGELNIVPSTG